ncbi:MAG: coproporphyrinogen dehydrogenase HemZ [Lachnospiraceae bacterium]|jgi:coproporphyrinogen dehydrogenase HemZ|nr:coproporphyrinogen dehydrogenase HemZ [Lachnospiraceae bacterium]NBJ82745.1 coproporphyrinogen dehydrogenase HemZ [bacterium 1XD42-76]NBK06036.1 coproporphyrinogen dehydrogenase HemZ [bacterium 1XD42-94]
MRGILLNDDAYEQDIRELLMAFYPGESFTHEKEDNVTFYVEGDWSGEPDGQFCLRLLEDGNVLGERTFPLDYAKRLEAKTAIKRELYGLLSTREEKELPWGTLTGIRPTKLALTRLSEGWHPDTVKTFMRDTYLTSEKKIDLSLEIAGRELDLLSGLDYENGYSLYVGIPFCPTTCLYCSFTSFPIQAWEERIPLYLEALFKELDYVARRMAGRPLNAVYFGGGTPTSLKAEEIDLLLSGIRERFDLSHVREFTVEAGRPDSITEEKLLVLRRHGISRISINPQTMKQSTLDLIGRRHTVEMVKEKYRLARGLGFDNINMDLIIGLPEETIDDVRATMEEIRRLAPDSLTVHSLAIKRAARLNMFREQYADLKIENTQEMVDLTADAARAMGLLPYYLYRQKNMAGNFENVGYAAPGKACIYNILIMEEKQTIIGCGAGTTTKVLFAAENRLERAENVKSVEQYMERIDEMIERKEKWLQKLLEKGDD